jgi:metal-responsive CopG/Arc/MetJ family transcriptional regulator
MVVGVIGVLVINHVAMVLKQEHVIIHHQHMEELIALLMELKLQKRVKKKNVQYMVVGVIGMLVINHVAKVLSQELVLVHHQHMEEMIALLMELNLQQCVKKKNVQ